MLGWILSSLVHCSCLRCHKEKKKLFSIPNAMQISSHLLFIGIQLLEQYLVQLGFERILLLICFLVNARQCTRH